LIVFFYGNFTLVPLNFIKFNLFQNVGAFYGTHPWYWYFVSGLPVMLGLMTPLFILGIIDAHYNFFTIIIFWNLIIYSFLPHKEYRFILQIMPLACYYCSSYISDYRKFPKTNFTRCIVVLMIISGILLLLTVGIFHQRGPNVVMSYLRSYDNATSIHFLMPCHSTPFYSHLHRNISMKILDCSPNIVNGTFIPIETEDEKFYKNPLKYLEDIKRLNVLPSHIVIFDKLANEISPFLSNNSYIKVANIFHTFYPIEERQSKYIQIFAKQNN